MEHKLSYFIGFFIDIRTIYIDLKSGKLTFSI